MHGTETITITIRCPQCREALDYHYTPEALSPDATIGLDDAQAAWARARLEESRAVDRDHFIDWAQEDAATNCPHQ